MSQASLKMRHLAKRLSVFECRAGTASEAKVPPAFEVFEKLRAYLGTFTGSKGICELVSCALPRARAEIPWLGAVHVKADGALEGLEELGAKHNRDELFEGGIVMVAQLLGLLVAFIGQSLTLRFLREVWPEVPLDDLAISGGDENENTE
jgi:hypothetical protein